MNERACATPRGLAFFSASRTPRFTRGASHAGRSLLNRYSSTWLRRSVAADNPNDDEPTTRLAARLCAACTEPPLPKSRRQRERSAASTTVDHAWLDGLLRDDVLQEVTRRLRDLAQADGSGDQAHTGFAIAGAAGSFTHLLAGAIAVSLQRPVLLAVAHLDEADDALEDLRLFNAAGLDLPAERFCALEVLPGESNVNLELLAERLAIVDELAGDSSHGRFRSGSPSVLIAPVQALMQSVPQRHALDRFTLNLRRGEETSPGRVLEWLERAGYARVDAIEQPGDFAVRGGVVDIFAPTGAAGPGDASGSSATGAGPTAIRLDYFGDEIDGINVIDTDTLASGSALNRFQLVGASADAILSDDDTTGLLSMIADDTVCVLGEPMEMAEQARGYFERLTDARGIISPPALMQQLTRRPHLEATHFGGAEKSLALPVRPLPSFATEAKAAVDELIAMANEPGHDVVVLCSQAAERDRLKEIIAEHIGESGEAMPDLALEVGYLHRGFVIERPDESQGDDDGRTLHVVPHHEVFHRYHTRRRIRKVSAGTRASDAFVDLEVGDSVVHEDHGIARFNGLKSLRRQGKTEDYLTLEFANKSLLHVPVAQIEKVQKYIGGFHGRPPLSVLGGKRWGKQKEQVREAVKDMAAELLRVQAARSSMPGIRYPADTAWQKEFEAEFPYDETDDQLAAIAEIKKDMADEQPMDRLICGDVGFGKTEVAIRAAFKAAEFGKQVAVLVPTTVLAEQHERTFRQRMADYPFRIASVSRFKTAGEAKETLNELSKGRVDIIIGTHRLLSKDVKFADLGMVIIDEEQRFGVEHKQKLLEFRLTADVLTLSATPIPRTLHMSMLGLRDISSLSTPPMDRRAVVTEVIQKDNKRIKQAIARELNREGQVFFVHNRVHDIQSVADDVRKLAPGARIVIGHGQMPGHELEKVMLKFMRREADILVSTTIIESGIDIPTANTMFIDDADIYGLAELHQLRGRVGRYKHRAYCYLLLPDNRPITDKATRRLRAIEQYAMLGAGFKIAMRDLEIRGAGNLLGPEQSGHIAAVGYQLYCQLLDTEAKKLRRDESAEQRNTHIELPIAGRLLPSYIPSQKQRMESYRRLNRAADFEELDGVIQGITDAYGKAPAQAETLFELAALRIAVGMLGVQRLKLEGPDLIFTTDQPKGLEPLFAGAPGRLTLIDQATVYYRPPANYLEPMDTLMAVLRKLLVRPMRQQLDTTKGQTAKPA